MHAFKNIKLSEKNKGFVDLVKKVGDKGRAFKIIDTKRGQLGHLQRELVPVLWPVTSNISWYVSIIIALLSYFKLMIMIDCGF